MKRKLEESSNEDVAPELNPPKKVKLTRNEAIIKRVNDIYSLHTTWELLYPYSIGSDPYHAMRWRTPFLVGLPYSISRGRYEPDMKQICMNMRNVFIPQDYHTETIENHYNASDDSGSVLSLDDGKILFDADSIDRTKQQIFNNSNQMFLQRTERIVLKGAHQMKIINDLVDDLVALSLVWNSQEFREKDCHSAVELLPLVLFDIEQVIQTQKSVMQSLAASDLGRCADSDSLTVIADFVCSDKSIAEQECITMIDAMMNSDGGCNVNYYPNYDTTFNTLFEVKDSIMGNYNWKPEWCAISNLEKNLFKKICFEHGLIS